MIEEKMLITVADGMKKHIMIVIINTFYIIRVRT